MTERQQIEKLKEIRRNREKQNAIINSDEIDRNKREWTSLWRRNINLYISHKLGIPTYPFQHVSYYLMGESTMYQEIATRGTSKSFKMAVYGIAECMLRPNSKVVITASTMQQASRLVEEKMERELFVNETLSPVLTFLYKNDLIQIRRKDQQLEVNFPFNNSVMYIVPCQDSARSLRATILMFEECRLMSKGKIDSIFEHMLQPRTAKYLLKLDLKERLELQEDTKSIYITSNRFKNEWFFKLFKRIFVGYFNDKENANRIFCADIFLALKYGLKSKKWVMSQKKTMNELDFKMEVLNEALGEAEGAYFSLDLFNKNQLLKKAFYPPNDEELANKSFSNRKKRPDETRLVCVDFAFADAMSGKQANDNTVIVCMGIYPKGDKWIKVVEYIETHSGGSGDTALLRIRELFWDYEADYVVFDAQNGGEVHYNDMTKSMEHPTRSQDEWKPNGFSTCMDKDINMVTEAKLNELANRTVDPKAIPVLIPIKGSPEFNSTMWMDFKNDLKNGEILFLIDDLAFKQSLESDKEFVMSSSSVKTKLQIPYIQTTLLINEAVNLSQSWNNGQVKLTEPSTGTKDRIIACAYGNAIAKKIINQMEKDYNQCEEDWSNFQIIF